jgi:hypothetical protein
VWESPALARGCDRRPTLRSGNVKGSKPNGSFCRLCGRSYATIVHKVMPSTVSRKPILVLDTSAINQLTAEKDFPAFAAGLTTAYSIRITGSNISELVATTESEKREQLLDTCKRLLASGDCIDPFAWIVEKHAKTFDQDSKHYDWKKVNVRNGNFEREIIERTLLADELARQEKESATETTNSFERTFTSMRPGFDEIFSNGTDRPTTFADFVNILQRPGGALKVRDFADHCPPFLMMVLAAVMAQYKRAIVEVPKKRKRAGRVDLLMSVYLPYCRVFVSHDKDQEVCLREMAAIPNLDKEILSYNDFRSRLLV